MKPLNKDVLRQIGQAVEAVGGDIDDARDLADTYARIQDRLAEANRLEQAGDTAAADAIGDELERDYAKPLGHIAADRIRARKEQSR